MTQVQYEYGTPNRVSTAIKLKEKRGKEMKSPQMFVHVKLSYQFILFEDQMKERQ